MSARRLHEGVGMRGAVVTPKVVGALIPKIYGVLGAV